MPGGQTHKWKLSGDPSPSMPTPRRSQASKAAFCAQGAASFPVEIPSSDRLLWRAFTIHFNLRNNNKRRKMPCFVPRPSL